MEEIRALSWKQPYASLMLHGKIEIRTWDTKYRGRVLICASKQPYTQREINAITRTRLFDPIMKFDWEEINGLCGKAIAIGTLANCRPMQKQDERLAFVNYNPDLWCHVYNNVQPIDPFDWKGTQGWKILDEETKAKIKVIE